MSPIPESPIAKCEDCELPYEAFPLDVILPDRDWLLIHPTGDGGLLCAACIAKRAAQVAHTIVLYARLVSAVDHEAFCVVKNVPLQGLAEALERSDDDKATQMLKRLKLREISGFSGEP
jgi:hypothetical protein